MRTQDDRFWSKVDFGEDDAACWLWARAKSVDGYGVFAECRTKAAKAHRWAYESLRGPIPAGLEIDHLCRIRHCVNPWHMEPVDHLTNVRRSPGRQSHTHCVRGHEFTPENTRYHPSAPNVRVCRACRRYVPLAEFLARGG